MDGIKYVKNMNHIEMAKMEKALVWRYFTNKYKGYFTYNDKSLDRLYKSAII